MLPAPETIAAVEEKLHHEIETMRAKQKFDWQKYVTVYHQVRTIQDEDQDALDGVKALFKHEQEQHLKWLQDSLRSPRKRAASI